MSLNTEFAKLAKDFFKAQGVTTGLTGEQHTALVRNWLCESILTDYSTEALDEARKASEAEPTDTELAAAFKHIKTTRSDMYTALYPLMNGSALRQKFEDAGILTKTSGGRKSANAEALAAKYV